MNGADPDAVPETPEQRRLLDAMGNLQSFLADLADREAEESEEDQQPDAQTQAAMHALCAADGAPLEWRSILNRVESGTQTWERVWREPRLEEGRAGVMLKTRALTSMAASELASISEHEETLLHEVDEINRRRMGR